MFIHIKLQLPAAQA